MLATGQMQGAVKLLVIAASLLHVLHHFQSPPEHTCQGRHHQQQHSYCLGHGLCLQLGNINSSGKRVLQCW
jgi:hypothetical protein